MEIDRLIDMLSARQSPQALLRSDEPVQVWNGTGWAAANTPLAGGQLNRMLGLIAPANVRAFVHDLNATYAFDYHHASGFYRVDVEAIKGKRTVFVTKLDPKGIPMRPRDAQEGMLDFGQTDDAISGVPTTPEVSPAPPTATQPSSPWKLEEVDEPAPTTVAPKKVAPQRTVVSVPVAPATQASPPPLPGTPSSGSQRFLPTTPQGTEQWYYGHADQSMGPHSKEEMAALIKSGALLPETMVFDSRVGDWQQAKLSALNGFFPLKTEGEWVNPSIKDWRPQTAGELKAEKAFVGLIGGSVVGALVLLVAWIGLAQYRGANRIHDYSAMFAQKVEADNAGTEALHNVQLHQADVEDDKEHMHYSGTGQYSNGFLADVDFNIVNRDFWAKPNDTTFTSTAHDFTPELSDLIKSKINSNLAKEESKVRVEEVDLSHGDGNSYSGTIRIGTKLRLPISAEITSYDKEGHIQNWTHDVSLD